MPVLYSTRVGAIELAIAERCGQRIVMATAIAIRSRGDGLSISVATDEESSDADILTGHSTRQEEITHQLQIQFKLLFI
jgi:hypothetical protein